MHAITAVIPNRNHGHLLRRAIDALLAQSAPPKEIIVVDDSSTDASCRVVDSYPKPVRLLRPSARLGTNGALNLGLYEVKTSHVYFGAADDYVLPGFFERALKKFEATPTAGLFYCPAVWHDYRTKLTWQMGTNTGKWSTSFIPTSSAVCNARQVRGLNGFREQLGCYADWFLMRQLLSQSPVLFSPVPGSRFHLYPDAYSSKPVSEEVLKDIAGLVRTTLPYWSHEDLLTQFGMPMRRTCPDLPLLPCLRRSAETWARKWLPVTAQKLLLQAYAY